MLRSVSKVSAGHGRLSMRRLEPQSVRFSSDSYSSQLQRQAKNPQTTVLAYADGASRGNPGRSGCGALLLDPSTREVIASSTLYVGDRETNNAAEYHGLLLALRLAQQHQATSVHVHMDSQLIVRQMQGQYRVKAANLRALYQQCKDVSAALGHVTFSYVARAENAAADRLANEAIDAYEAPATRL